MEDMAVESALVASALALKHCADTKHIARGCSRCQTDGAHVNREKERIGRHNGARDMCNKMRATQYNMRATQYLHTPCKGWLFASEMSRSTDTAPVRTRSLKAHCYKATRHSLVRTSHT